MRPTCALFRPRYIRQRYYVVTLVWVCLMYCRFRLLNSVNKTISSDTLAVSGFSGASKRALSKRARKQRDKESLVEEQTATELKNYCLRSSNCFCEYVCTGLSCLSSSQKYGRFEHAVTGRCVRALPALTNPLLTCFIAQEPHIDISLPLRCYIKAVTADSCAPAALCRLTSNNVLQHILFDCVTVHAAPPLLHSKTVPNVVHWVSPGPANEQFPYWAYVHASAISDVLQPAIFYFHHIMGCLPSGPWWNATSKLLTLVPHQFIDQIYGNAVHLTAHRSDVMRLSALIQYGGIYMDMDVLTLSTFTPLMRNEFVIGIQGPLQTANAVLLSTVGAPFAIRWLDAYHNFTESDWDGHSVRLPWRLAELHPDLVVWLPRTAWFSPGPDEYPCYEVFERNISEAHFRMQKSHFAVHVWHQICALQLERITGPSWFDEHKLTLYARFVNRLSASGEGLHVAAALTTSITER